MNKSPPIPIAVNFHLYKPCYYPFATFRDIQSQLSPESALELLSQLREAGKINFAGGERTLHPHISEFVEEAWRLGFVTSLVTNGTRLDTPRDAHADTINPVGLSVDRELGE